ncbi:MULTISPECIES: hemolysin family protein [Brevibacterium]|jgi:CBS domain containing-hemolysin-like protein|uniref:Hemolysin family protein n=1 Tax=Brevibacterium salitolerans TaxID=1403566 RepID=A0ABN2WCI6_9MICO|nr:hemolysin family protein [Brevibacterium sp.]
MSDWMGLVWLVVLLLGNAFFVAAEFGIVSAKRSQIEPYADGGSKRAQTTLYAMSHVSVMLAICQLGITVCSLLLGNVAEPAIHHLLVGPLSGLGIPAGLSDVISFVLALAAVTYLHVVVGEMIPKNIAIALSRQAAMMLAPPLVFLARVFGFVIRPLNSFANGVLRLLGVTPRDEVNAAYTVEEVQSIVVESQREGLLRDESGLLKGALEFSDKSVAEAMVPRADLVTVSEQATPEEVEGLVGRTGYSRYIVTDSAGTPRSYLHIKDLLYADNEADYRAPVQSKRFRSMTSVAADAEIEDALDEMRSAGSHVARVLDAAGEAVGVVFLEDVLEELVGEVDDAMQRHRARGLR